MRPAVHYTVHARQRMRQRHISAAEVTACLSQPEVIYPDGRGHLNVLCGTLRVVLTCDRKKVITVVRLSRHIRSGC